MLVSEYEGLSHTLLEVSALGTPAVASDVCGNPEVIENEVNGLTVPKKDVEALRKAIRRMLDDPDLRRRSVEAGLARIDRYTPETSYGSVERALASVAGTKALRESADQIG